MEMGTDFMGGGAGRPSIRPKTVMKIVKGYPPIIDKIKEKFTIHDTTVYTWGDTIFTPAGVIINDHVMIHEEIHEWQQRRIGSPEAWWERYLADPAFRFQQELEAYQAQYKFFMKHHDRNKVFFFLHGIAGDLSGELYGHMVTYDKAKRLIKT